jgi:hypothetical protein
MKLKPIAVLGFLVLMTTSLGGCGSSMWSHRDTNPSIQDQVYTTGVWSRWFGNPRSVNTFATTASRRVVIVAENLHNHGDVITCSEPPPDVGEAFASAVADGFKIAAKDPKSGITGDLANQYARAVATQIAPLLYRTQGLQLYRDGLHNLCIDKMNKWLGNEDDKASSQNYVAQKQALIDKAIDLIKAELPLMLQAQQAFYQNAKAGIGIGELQKMAEILKSLTAATTPPSGPSRPSEPNTEPSSPPSSAPPLPTGPPFAPPGN